MNDDITQQILQKHVDSGERETHGGVSESELSDLLCGTTNDDKPFEKGEIIEFCGEHLEIVDNFGSSGNVKYPNDETETFKYYWSYQDEKCRRV